MLNPNLSFRTCVGPEAFISTTILKIFGGRYSSEGQEGYMLKNIRSYPTNNNNNIKYK